MRKKQTWIAALLALVLLLSASASMLRSKFVSFS